MYIHNILLYVCIYFDILIQTDTHTQIYTDLRTLPKRIGIVEVRMLIQIVMIGIKRRFTPELLEVQHLTTNASVIGRVCSPFRRSRCIRAQLIASSIREELKLTRFFSIPISQYLSYTPQCIISHSDRMQWINHWYSFKTTIPCTQRVHANGINIVDRATGLGVSRKKQKKLIWIRLVMWTKIEIESLSAWSKLDILQALHEL